jgi:hypothetical protein
MRELEVPNQYRKLYARAMSGRSRKFVIRCYCLMRCGWQWSEAGKCTATYCPLFTYRLATSSQRSGKTPASSGGSEDQKARSPSGTVRGSGLLQMDVLGPVPTAGGRYEN